MSSTDGQICFGILFEEDTEFPWDNVELYDDIQDWWIYSVHGFRHSFEMFDNNGNWIGGDPWPDEEINKYYAEQRQFEKNCPALPIERINYCSGDYPMWILAVPDTYHMASRGCPEEFLPGDLVVTKEQKEELIEFCHTHGIEFTGEPAWYLSSFWG